MRKDMFKVIVERSRINPKTHKKGRQKSFEDLPRKESMRKPYDWNWNRKSLNENLKPLVRFLKSKVGKQWDNVFSEICENLKLDSAIQKHVRDHVFDYVKIHVSKEEGKVFHLPKYYGKWTELWNQDLYVDPDNGILKIYKVKSSLRKKKDYLKEYLDVITSEKSKTLVEDGKVYKLFFDKFTKDYTIRYEATEKHADNDFKDKKGYFGDNCEYLKRTITAIQNQTKVKSPYFNQYLKTLDKTIEKKKSENKVKAKPFKVGDLVSFTSHWAKAEAPQEGVINFIDYTDDLSQFIASISVGTKNIRVHSTMTRISKKAL